MGSEEQHPYSRYQQVKNVPIKVTLFNKQNMIWDMFADILNSENQQYLCIGNVYQLTGLCCHSRTLSSKVTAIRKQKQNKTKPLAYLFRSGEKGKMRC